MLGKSKLLERSATLANLQKLGNAGIPAGVLGDGHQPCCIAIRQGVEEGSFEQGKDGGVAADSECEDQHDESGDAGVAAQENAVSYTHLRAHETRHDLVCRLL